VLDDIARHPPAIAPRLDVNALGITRLATQADANVVDAVA
jgi:hypothetical protein